MNNTEYQTLIQGLVPKDWLVHVDDDPFTGEKAVYFNWKDCHCGHAIDEYFPTTDHDIMDQIITPLIFYFESQEKFK